MFFHLNGIVGDPYKTLTLALTGKMTVKAAADDAAEKIKTLIAQRKQ